MEPVLPLMAISLTTTHSGLRTPNGFRSLLAACHQSAATIQTMLSELRSKFKGMGGLMEIVVLQPKDRWSLLLNLLKISKTTQALQHEGHTKFFSRLYHGKKLVLTNHLEKK